MFGRPAPQRAPHSPAALLPAARVQPKAVNRVALAQYKMFTCMKRAERRRQLASYWYSRENSLCSCLLPGPPEGACGGAGLGGRCTSVLKGLAPHVVLMRNCCVSPRCPSSTGPCLGGMGRQNTSAQLVSSP